MGLDCSRGITGDCCIDFVQNPIALELDDCYALLLNLNINHEMTTAMNSTKTSKKNKFLGVPFVKGDKINQDNQKVLIANLFLNPQITVAHVEYYLSQIEAGKMSIERLMKMSTKGLATIKSYKSLEYQFSDVMQTKIKQWFEVFGVPTGDDWAYIKKHHGLNREIFMKENVCLPMELMSFHSAKEMATHVKQYVICQDAAIEAFSVPVFLQNESRKKRLPFRMATPMVLIGRTGSGKSEMCFQFGQICECPIFHINSSEVVPTSWRGQHITDKLAQAIQNGMTIDELRYAIIVFDEFDKISHHGQRIVSDKGSDFDTDMMRDIMKLFETGQDLFLECGLNSNDYSTKGYRLPTDNLLVVFAGAFNGIENIVRKRVCPNNSIGFSKSTSSTPPVDDLLKLVTTEDLKEWGFMPELIGRIGNICVLNSLTSEMIYRIMTTAKNSVLQSHIEYCQQHNIKLKFTPKALRLIADEAYKSGLGFRNVKTLLSKCLNSLYYELRDEPEKNEVQTVNIDQDYIVKQLNLQTK